MVADVRLKSSTFLLCLKNKKGLHEYLHQPGTTDPFVSDPQAGTVHFQDVQFFSNSDAYFLEFELSFRA